MGRQVVRLPDAEYARMYEATVVPRVDLWLMNPSGKVALAQRRAEPHADWWLPGGRFRPNMALSEAVMGRARQDMGLNIELGRLSEVGIEHYRWGMPSFGITAQLIGSVWCGELTSVEVAGLRISTKYLRLAWYDPVELAELRSVDDPSLAKIARSVLAYLRR